MRSTSRPAPPAAGRPAARHSLARRSAVLLALLAAAGCAGAHRPGPAAPVGSQVAAPVAAPPTVVLRPCTMPGVEGTVRCGEVPVWEDREARAGRRIGLRVVVLAARAADPAPDPVVVLAGGPGQGAAELAPALARDLDSLRARRDLVLVDQRGTGASNRLDCPGGLAALADSTGAGLRACAAALAAHADVRHYTTRAAVDDLDDVRAALGLAHLNLLGVSYGTRVAQVYLRRHPARVRTVTLRAVAPLGFNIPRDGAHVADRALRAMVDDCAADRACAAAFPDLARDVDTVLARAAAAPVHARVALPGRAADGVDVTIDRALVARTLYALLLSVPTRQQLPLLLHRAATRGLATLAPMAAQVQAAVYTQVPAGLYLSVVCAEDAPGITDADQRALARTAVGATGDIRAACRAWPGAAREADRQDAAPPAGRTAVAWAGPALLLSGAADPATDAAGAERLARAWPQARHVVLPATAHGPLLPGCARDLVVAFVDQAEAAGLDAACLRTITWPAFATGVAAR